MSNLKSNQLKKQWLLLLGLMLVAAMLRAPITSVGPVIDLIKIDLNISNTTAGFLTTIPLLIFGIISPYVPKIVDTFTINKTIFYAILLVIFGLIIRTFASIELFIVGTVILGIGIAIGNVTIPSYVKLKFPMQVGFVTGLYGAVMNGMAGVGGGISVPLAQMSQWSFRLSLSIWIIIAFFALIIWLKQLKPQEEVNLNSENLTESKSLRIRHLLKSELVWAIALSFGLQSMIFYSIVAWIPSILIEQGLTPRLAGYYFMFSQFIQIPIAFFYPQFVEKISNKRIPVYIIFVCFITGFSLLLISKPSVLLIGMLIMGVGAGAVFSTCMVFFSIKARTYDGSILLSGFSQSIGYIIAAAGPLIMGLVQDYIHSDATNIFIFMALSIILFITLIIAARPEYIEDTIKH